MVDVAALGEATVTILARGLPPLPPHPVRGRWTPIAAHVRDPWGAVWFVCRTKKTSFAHLTYVARRSHGVWGTPDPSGGSTGGCPDFVDQRTRGWRRPQIDDHGGHFGPIRTWASRLDVGYGFGLQTLTVVEGIAAVLVDTGDERWVEAITSPVGAIVLPLPRTPVLLTPLDEHGVEMVFAGVSNPVEIVLGGREFSWDDEYGPVVAEGVMAGIRWALRCRAVDGGFRFASSIVGASSVGFVVGTDARAVTELSWGGERGPGRPDGTAMFIRGLTEKGARVSVELSSGKVIDAQTADIGHPTMDAFVAVWPPRSATWTAVVVVDPVGREVERVDRRRFRH